MMRALWWLTLALLAAIAVAAQVDRASARRPELAAFVPKPFRGFAQPTVTMLAYAAGTPEAARAEARRLIRKRPIPAEHIYLLALADLNAGDKNGYARAFEIATTRGWRAIPVQVAAAEAAIAAGDAAAAAPRVAALWALEGESAALRQLVTKLLALPDGRKELGKAVAVTRVTQGSFTALMRALGDDKRLTRSPALGDGGMVVEAR